MPTTSDSRFANISACLRLGELVRDYNALVHPTAYERRAGSSKDPKAVRKQIDILTERVQQLVALSDDARVIRKLFGLRVRQSPPSDVVQTLCIVAHGDFVDLRQGGDNVDSIAYRMASILSDDQLEGIWQARKAVAMLLGRGVLELNGTSIHLGAQLQKWISGNDPLLRPRLSESELRAHLSAGQSVTKHSKAKRSVASFVRRLPVLTPAEMVKEIRSHGYVAQDGAVRTVSLHAYRHINRLRKIHIDGIDADQLPRPSHLLCSGSTGCGKTYLVQLLFERVLGMQNVITVDATTFTEVGYVGDDVASILTRLLHASDRNVDIAQIGIACIDEIDKISGRGGGNTPFGGAGSTKDVSGLGVQRSLLKMLEPSEIDVPVQLGVRQSQERRVKLKTDNIMFIGCGAFSGLETCVAPANSIGFESGSPNVPMGNTFSAQSFCRYGLQPELVGRFGAYISFDALPREAMIEILETQTIARYRNELEIEGITLRIEPAVIDTLVDHAIEQGTGARGLSQALTAALDDASFEAFSESGQNRSVTLYMEDDKIMSDVSRSRAKKHSTKGALHTPVYGSKCATSLRKLA